MDDRIIYVMTTAVLMLLTGWMVYLAVYRWFYRREDRLLTRLQKLLDDVAEGKTVQETYDESKLSALENAMKHFLTGNETASRQVEEQKQKIEALITDISHQSITPISNIMLYAELAEEEAGDSGSEAAVKEEAAAIREQAEKLDFLIQSLVKVSRLETGMISVHPQTAEIGSIFEAVEQQFSAKAKQEGITLQVSPVSMRAQFDCRWTTEAVANLVDNAVKYSKPGGTVSVRAEAYEIFVRIDVEDDGIGIAEEEQNKIFARFYRSLDVQDSPGAGIGLFLSREIIQKQKGYMKVVSEKGRGSLFSVFLPR